jgi:hypothetical protein
LLIETQGNPPMTAWPTQTAIHAATHGTSARDAERRARMDAIENATAFVFRVLVRPSHKRRFSLPALDNSFTAKILAAHKAIGA